MPGELPSVGSNQTWDRLRREYPGLAEIAATNPGRSARESYLREVAAERVRTGLGQLARTSRRTTSGSSSGGEASEEETAADREDMRVIPPTSAGHTEAEFTVDSKTLTRQPTSVSVSESEGEEEVKKEELKEEKLETTKAEPAPLDGAALLGGRYVATSLHQSPQSRRGQARSSASLEYESKGLFNRLAPARDAKLERGCD